MKPLDGIIVLDLTRLLPGAVASQILSNFGAEVIKIEESSAGDYAREMPPLIEGHGAFFLLTNYGKKSVAIDLKNPKGKEAFLRLVVRADVLVEGFRPGVMERLGLGYELLREHNARLIYAAITGYGQSGQYADLAGHDINYAALGGLLNAIAGPGLSPSIPGVQLADLVGGSMQAVIGILLALAARSATERGQMVDVAMMDGIMPLLTIPLAEHLATKHEAADQSKILSGRYACYHIYETLDGKWISVGALEQKFWAALCNSLGCAQFIEDQFADDERQAGMKETLAKIFKTRNADEWFELLGTKDACVTPLNTIAEVVRDAHLRERGMIVSVNHPSLGVMDQIGVSPRLGDTPGEVSSLPPPQLGEHTREMLRWAGFSNTEVEELEREQVIRTGSVKVPN
jgi:crotonobetainyl-CoA:carnitine CoA-transferase CaiB-like acyl-CoA transferase